MTDADLWGLPSPDYHAEFYEAVPTKRLIAFLIDGLLIVILTLLVLIATAFLTLLIFPLVAACVSFVYRTATLARYSATPGMWIAAIEFRNFRGERLDLFTAAAHTVVFTVMFAMVVPQALSVLSMLVTPRRQGLADLLLGTAAINRAAVP